MWFEKGLSATTPDFGCLALTGMPTPIPWHEQVQAASALPAKNAADNSDLSCSGT